jgi:hypothetical protein
MVEKYVLTGNVRLRAVKPNRNNALSNLVVTVDQKCKDIVTGKKRMFIITGTQSPGGSRTDTNGHEARGPMLRVTTMIVESGSQTKPCPMPGAAASDDPQPTGRAVPQTDAGECEDYPDDEMLEEYEYDETEYPDPDQYDPPLEGYEYDYESP